MIDNPQTGQAALRDRIRHALCQADGFGFAWGTDMLEPDEYGEVADAVLAVLPNPAVARRMLALPAMPVPPATHAAVEEHRLALSQALDLGTGAPWDAIHERVQELRRVADEAQQQPDTETVTEAEAERLSALTDCPDSHSGGQHCGHYQEGDGPCCNCQRPNWCPEGGVA